VKAPPIPSDARLFRMAIVPLIILIFVGGFIVGHAMGISVLVASHRSPFPWHLLSIIICYSVPLILIYACIMALAISLFFPSCITSNGIHGYSFWGSRSYLGWAEITRAEKASLVNLKFLRLYNNAGNAIIWLPLFQSARTEFQSEIRKFAPPNHPILSHLG
jgi:hypothetical protein